MEGPDEILTKNYKELPISNSLKRFFAFHSLPNLEAVLRYGSKELLQMKWFNAELYRQLIVVLDDHGLLDRLH